MPAYIKNILIHKMSFSSKPYIHYPEKKVVLHLSNYVTKSISKDATSINTSKFAKKADLDSLKLGLDK